jgi:hypothetical protein
MPPFSLGRFAAVQALALLCVVLRCAPLSSIYRFGYSLLTVQQGKGHQSALWGKNLLRQIHPALFGLSRLGAFFYFLTFRLRATALRVVRSAAHGSRAYALRGGHLAFLFPWGRGSGALLRASACSAPAPVLPHRSCAHPLRPTPSRSAAKVLINPLAYLFPANQSAFFLGMPPKLSAEAANLWRQQKMRLTPVKAFTAPLSVMRFAFESKAHAALLRWKTFQV